jgi:hypothetical protein
MKKRLLISAAVFVTAMVLVGLMCSCGRDTVHYDFTGEFDNIGSVEFINIVSLKDYYGGDSGAEVLRIIPENEWKDVLSAAAKLEYYRPFPNPNYLREGEALKITFKQPVDGKVFVLYSRFAFADAKIKDGEVVIESYAPQCSEEDWEKFTRSFR